MNLKLLIYSVLCVLSAAVLIASLVFFGLFNNIINNKVKEELPIKKNNNAFKIWKNSGVPISIKFSIFHVKNPEQFKNNKSAKIVLEERGPYVFDEIREKVNINFTDNNTLVTYEERKTYYFNQALSKNNSLNDRVTIVNLPFLGILQNSMMTMGEMAVYFIEALIEAIKEKKHDINPDILNETDLFLNITVGQLLYHGYQVKFIDVLRKQVKKGLNKDIPQVLPNDTFGIFFDKNGTILPDNLWTVYTGVHDMDNFLNLYEYNNKKHLTWWNDKEGSECKNFHGTEGTQYKPPVNKDRTLYVYSPDLCRRLEFVYESDEKTHGIDVLRFIISKRAFQNPFERKENMCYCTSKMVNRTSEESCNVTGILDISTCIPNSYGAPIGLSAPHFYEASEWLKNRFIGIKTDENTDKTFIDIEPYTGIALKISKKLQINAIIPNEINIFGIPEPTLFFPVLWLYEGGEVTDEKANELKDRVLSKVHLGTNLIFGGIIVGALVLLLSIVFVFYQRKRSRSKSVNFSRPL